jgi:hypothetical protein
VQIFTFLAPSVTTRLDVDYRCVRCRSCSDGRNADQTEKVSLRDEQELQQHMDSVLLDKINKKYLTSVLIQNSDVWFLTYQGIDQEFWKSRTAPRKIQIFSTEIYEPGGSSVLGGLNSSQVSLDLDEALLESEVFDIGEDCQEQFQFREIKRQGVK